MELYSVFSVTSQPGIFHSAPRLQSSALQELASERLSEGRRTCCCQCSLYFVIYHPSPDCGSQCFFEHGGAGVSWKFLSLAQEFKEALEGGMAPRTHSKVPSPGPSRIASPDSLLHGLPSQPPLATPVAWLLDLESSGMALCGDTHSHLCLCLPCRCVHSPGADNAPFVETSGK